MKKERHQHRIRNLAPLQEAMRAVAAPAIAGSRRAITRVRLDWALLCGPTLAAHTEPGSIKGNRLTILARNEEWALAFHQIHENVYEELKVRFPFLKMLHVKVDKGAFLAQTPASSVIRAKRHHENESIAHPGLRDACDALATLRDESTKDCSPSPNGRGWDSVMRMQFLLLLVAITYPSLLAASSPPQNAGSLLDRHSGPWAVVEIQGKTAHRAGHRYEARAAGWLGIDGPKTFNFVVHGPRHKDLTLDAFYLLAMNNRNGGWRARVEPSGVIRVDRRLVRPALAFVRTWRENQNRPSSTRLDEWLGLLAHPFKYARITAWRRLVAGSDSFRKQMDPQRLTRLGAPLLEPEFDKSDRKQVVKLFGILGRKLGAQWLAEHWHLLRPTSVQRSAAVVMAEYPSKETIRVLRECQTNAPVNLRGRCQRLLERLLRTLPKVD